MLQGQLGASATNTKVVYEEPTAADNFTHEE